MTSAAGLLAAIPAMSMLGHELGYLELTLWAAAGAYLGVFFAVPLRRQMVVVEALRFPSGTATAETIVSMGASGAEAAKKARYLLVFLAISLLWALAFYFIPELGSPPIGLVPVFTVFTVWGFTLLLSPLMFGAGILIGPRIGASLLVGSVLAWGIVGPLLVANGVVAGPFFDGSKWVAGTLMSFEPLSAEKAAKLGAPESMIGLPGARAWLLWPGVALMIADAFGSLALNWRSFVNTFRIRKASSDGVVDTVPDAIPNAWWIGGLLVSSVFTTLVAWWFFDIPPYFTVIAIALSSVLAAIAVRSSGETDINPVGGMGKVTQLAFAGLAPGAVATNLMTAAITGAGASQAADMMHDLKTGYLLGASPRRQFLAQLIGIAAGVVVCVPAYVLFDTVYDIGGMNQEIAGAREAMPAPAAHAWKGFAELLAIGLDALPAGAIWAVLVAFVVGAALPVARSFAPAAVKTWIPSGLAIGIAFIVDPPYAIIMFLGSMFLAAWTRMRRETAIGLSFAVASGLVAGEGLMGLGKAFLQIAGVPNLWQVLYGVKSLAELLAG